VPAGGALRFPHKAGTVVAAIMPVRMPDGQVICFPAPRFVAFDLIEAKRHLDGASACESALSNSYELHQMAR
jgi:hypothetical protein